MLPAQTVEIAISIVMQVRIGHHFQLDRGGSPAVGVGHGRLHVRLAAPQAAVGRLDDDGLAVASVVGLGDARVGRVVEVGVGAAEPVAAPGRIGGVDVRVVRAAGEEMGDEGPDDGCADAELVPGRSVVNRVCSSK